MARCSSAIRRGCDPPGDVGTDAKLAGRVAERDTSCGQAARKKSKFRCSTAKAIGGTGTPVGSFCHARDLDPPLVTAVVRKNYGSAAASGTFFVSPG